MAPIQFNIRPIEDIGLGSDMALPRDSTAPLKFPTELVFNFRLSEGDNLLSDTFIKVCVILGVLREGEAVGDLQPVVDNQAQQDALNHLAALALFLVVLNNLQHHL
ncbi:hypothetical protein GOODEAATRI_007250 [Goodea atripinnis]|uniref:Uncharacterized protein n=1 Tax=Goodea atripinnis TaxID=208336 RepID=A0ABV0PC40_9TELE